MGTRGWNGRDNLSAADVVELYRPDAAQWFRAVIDPSGLTRADEDLDALAENLASTLGQLAPEGPRESHDAIVDAIRYAAECATESR